MYYVNDGPHKDRSTGMCVCNLFDGEVVDQVMVVFVQVTVQGHTVALVQQVLQCVHSLYAQRSLQTILQVRVIKYHAEAKHLRPDRYCLPRTPCTHAHTPTHNIQIHNTDFWNQSETPSRLENVSEYQSVLLIGC